jgi:hypothetical protein
MGAGHSPNPFPSTLGGAGTRAWKLEVAVILIAIPAKSPALITTDIDRVMQ